MRSHPTYVCIRTTVATTCILPAAVEGDCWQIGGCPEYSPKNIKLVPLLTLRRSTIVLIWILLQTLTLNEGSPQAQGVIEAVRTCWRDDVYLDELGHRFWRLTLQIILPI
jgi:hypothetical protein